VSTPPEQTASAPIAHGLPDAPQVLEGLNDAQRQAVTHLGGPLLIVAGAGSGKTRTLTRRFVWLVTQGVQTERILALTYTNDAAAELAERLDELLGDDPGEINAVTFHALCMNVLRDESAAAGLNPFFSTATEPDRVAIMLARINELTFEHTSIRGNAAAVLGNLVKMIDRLKEECVGPDELRAYAEAALADAASEDDRDTALLLAEQARLYAKHDEFMRDAAALDFGGMQFELYKLLRRDDRIRARVARRYEHILVDEFQDTSFVQLEILKLLAQDHHNIAAVGDDDQSIYKFRGASPRSILDFERRFGPATEIALELNYRSAPPIIAAARAIVALILPDRRRPKQLTAAPENQDGEVLFVHASSEVGEAQAIVTEIERLIADVHVEPREICILANKRSHVDVLADRLGAHDIPFSRDTRDFFKRFEVRVPLSWLKVLGDPTLNEDAWRLMSAHPIGIDSGEYAQLMRWMRKQKHPHVIEAMRSAVRSRQFTPETIDKIRQFNSLYDQMNAVFNELTPGEFTIRLINAIAIKGTVLLESGGDAPDRLANLSKLQRLAEEFATRNPQAAAREFAIYITSMAEAGFDEPSESAEQDPNAVRLLTAHSSKGLEFDYVFVPGMIAARWPGKRGSGGSVPAPLLKDPMPPLPGKDPEREAFIEETRRLAHVAMTRARRQLMLSWFDDSTDPTGTGRTRTKVSPFFEEAQRAVEAAGFPAEVREFQERDFETTDFVYAEMEMLRRELMRSLDRTGADLGEMRLDASSGTPYDFARFAELIKLSALTHRLRHGQSIADALPEINAMLEASMSKSQISAYRASDLDDRLEVSEQRVAELGRAIQGVTPELSNFLPTINNRLRLSASAIGSYQRCPKQYEYENVLRIPTADQSHLRLGITVHNVLERFHKDLTKPLSVEETRERLHELLDQQLIAGGWGRTDDEKQLLARARAMLDRYAEDDFARPPGDVRTEVKFSLSLPQTEKMKETKVGGRILDGIQINGKIDRIDTLPDGSQRVVDYKTGNDKGGAVALRNKVAKEVQLAIYKYAGARELGIDAEGLVYYFLENPGHPVIEAEATPEHVDAVRATIDEVADKIISLDFTPAPDFQKCSTCQFRHVCPATEA
jgi:DNA helicase-2/ATP-dependent DNA helicase PcrA